MKITAVTTAIIAIPRTARLRLFGGRRDDATTVLVQLETDAGITGIGQTVVDPPAFGAAGIKANIDAYLAPLMIGESPLEIAHLHRVMERTLPGHRVTHAAIDLALWDLTGKARGVSVSQSPRIPVSPSPSRCITMSSPPLPLTSPSPCPRLRGLHSSRACRIASSRNRSYPTVCFCARRPDRASV